MGYKAYNLGVIIMLISSYTWNEDSRKIIKANLMTYSKESLQLLRFDLSYIIQIANEPYKGRTEEVFDMIDIELNERRIVEAI